MINALTKTGVILLALALTSTPALAEQWQYDEVDRIVAISDVHGAYDAMVKTLQNAAVINDALEWAGGQTHLVIVGDLLDRGPNSRDAMDLLMRLEEEAVVAGGLVHVLIGNHEAMNLSGDLRYVSRDEYAAFADDELVEDRERWFSAYQNKRAPAGVDAESSRIDFDEKYPPGYFGHRRAFAPDGVYGNWLLSKPVIVVINGTAFVHGGLSPMVVELGLQGVNGDLVADLGTYVGALQQLFEAEILLPTDSHYEYAARLSGFSLEIVTNPGVAQAVADVMRLDDSDLQAPDGPLWYRNHSYCNKVIEADRLDQSLAAIGATRVVIGHTPSYGRRVLERFDGRVYEVDTGMLSSHYKGSGNALVIEADRLYVINQNSGEAVPPTSHPRQVGRRPAAPMLAQDIESLLQGGSIDGRSEDAAGRVIVSVSDANFSVDAEFIENAKRGVYPDVAAYRLDRLLELDMVPVAVKREVDGDEGSLQFVPARWIDEQQRQLDQSGGGANCPLPDQWEAMLVFDILLGNDRRGVESIRYDASSFDLMLVGHKRAFSTSGSKPARYKDVPVKVGPAWKEELTSLTDDMLQDEFAGLLDKRRIKALAKRRDLLISE
ncbi:MAG: metallophosphoesterase [Woeseiaceae bacterium]